MGNSIKGLGLIQIDQCSFDAIFSLLLDVVHQVQVVLDWSFLHSIVLLRSNQIANDKLQTFH